ncbi:MAG: hypothetical protein M3495_11080 [Pseudomonadota bacterium]|nr:hypothetical protein [Gammaproteobacteria bacterium]MDQ3582109.1 hypothetical protein [Pseudomonadota bacterium]
MEAERQQEKTGEAQLIARDHPGEAAVVEELGEPGGGRERTSIGTVRL